MKVLQINATYDMGSTGTIVKDIQECCEENGIACFVAYSLANIQEDHIKGYKIGNYLSKKIHALLCRINGKQGYFSYFSTLQLLQYIDELKPDVIHLHNLHSNYINIKELLSYISLHNIATIITLHDCWFYTGGCFHYTNVNCYKWLDKCGDCPKKTEDTPAYLFDKSEQILKDRYKWFNAISKLTVVGVSRWITEECQKSVFKNRETCTIYNGVDTSIFKPTDSDIRAKYKIDDKYVVLGPGSKWLDPINQNVLNCVAAGLDKDMVLFLFGCNFIPKTLPENVIAIGFINSKEELARLYSMADVFVNCTREDSFPTINIESQACGTPVITFDNTGAKETVDGKCGFVVKTGDGDSLLREIIRSKHIKLKQTLTREIQTRAECLYDKNNNYKKYIDLYKHTV